MNMTKKQNTRAGEILAVLLKQNLPDKVTPREATDICARYSVLNDRFQRIAKAKQDFNSIGIAEVAVEIAKKEIK